MKIVIIGGTGLVGSKLVSKLREHGHQAVPASPDTGVNTLTGQGLAEALAGADVVVDVSNSPSFEDAAVLKFFETSTGNLLAAEAAAGVRHHVALSVVGTERLTESGYFRAKIAQENLIRKSSIPYSIVHATQFFEFIKSIADAATRGHGAARAGADSAHGRRRCREGRGPCVRGVPDQRDRRSGGATAVPARRAGPGRPPGPHDAREVVADPEARYSGRSWRSVPWCPGTAPASPRPASRTG